MDKFVKLLKDFVKSHKFEFTVLFIIFFLFLLFGRVNAASNTDIEYIYSYGVGEYIDTGIVPTANTEIEIQFEDIDPCLAYERIFSIDKQFGLMRDNNSSNQWKVECGDNWSAGTVSIPSTGINTVKMGNGIVTVNGVSFSYSGVPNTSKSIYLFHGNGTDRNSSIRIYYCKIWENSSLVRDFVPAIDDSNVVCMYDKVSSSFFYNSGSGVLGSSSYTPSDDERGVFEFTVGDDSYTVPELPTYHNEFNINKFIILEYRGEVYLNSFTPKDGFEDSDIKTALMGKSWSYENCHCRIWKWYGTEWVYDSWQPNDYGYNYYEGITIWGSSFDIMCYTEGTGFYGISYAANIDVGISSSSLPSLNINISNSNISNGYVTLKTTNFPSEMLGLYKVKYCVDDGVWLDMELLTSWQYSVTVGNSGVYKFSYFDIDTDEFIEGSPVSTLSVNTVLNNIKFDALVVEPRLSANIEVNDDEGTIIVWVETQDMSTNSSLDCYFIQNDGDVSVLDNILNWTKVDSVESYDGGIRKITYKFPVYDTCRVYCVFHNPEKGNYGYSNLVYIDIDIDKMYQDYLAGIDEDNNPIIDFIVRLFVPDENFFSNIFSLMNEFFGETFGVLYYPIEVVFDFLNRFYFALTNDDGTAVLNVPEVKFMDNVLIPAFTFDFYSILEDDTFKMLHNIYLMMVDVIFTIMLLILAKNIFSEIVGSRTVDSDIGRVIEDYNLRKVNAKKIPIGFRRRD